MCMYLNVCAHVHVLVCACCKSCTLCIKSKSFVAMGHCSEGPVGTDVMELKFMLD